MSARLVAVNLELMEDGYLSAPDGERKRHIDRLDEIGRDMATEGVRVSWFPLKHGRPAECDIPRKWVLLDPWLYGAMPYYIRKVLVHEFLHAVTGMRCEVCLSGKVQSCELGALPEWERPTSTIPPAERRTRGFGPQPG